ncbi:MAG: MBL fold metallo-hydrolase, partial [Candidatus Dormibacteria bacterium]
MTMESLAERVEIVSFADPYFDQNCVILRRRDTGSALVIDPGLQVAEVSDYIDRNDLQVEHILLTHGHLDHVFGVPVIREQTGAPVYMHPLDQAQLKRNPTVVRQFGLDP